MHFRTRRLRSRMFRLCGRVINVMVAPIVALRRKRNREKHDHACGEQSRRRWETHILEQSQICCHFIASGASDQCKVEFPACYSRGSRFLGAATRGFPARPKWCSNAFRSTFLPRKRTPSASNRNRCSRPNSPRSEIRPPEPSTRCQGNPPTNFRTRATCRAHLGYPAALAIAP